MMTGAKAIDQPGRAYLCSAILLGEPWALVALTELYRRAGYPALANVLEATDGKEHARAILGDNPLRGKS